MWHISHEFVWYQFCSCSAIGNIYISEKQKRVGKKASCSQQRRAWWDICQSCLSKIQRPIHSGMWSSSAWHLIHYTWARNHHQTEEWWSIVSARTFVLPKKLDLFVGTQCVLHTVYTLFTTQAQSRFDPDMRKVDWICRDAKEKSWYFSKAYCTFARLSVNNHWETKYILRCSILHPTQRPIHPIRPHVAPRYYTCLWPYAQLWYHGANLWTASCHRRRTCE